VNSILVKYKILPSQETKTSIAKSLLFFSRLSLRQIRLLRDITTLSLRSSGSWSTLLGGISGTFFLAFFLLWLLVFFALCAVLGLGTLLSGRSLLLLGRRSAWRGVC
jgi:hypothetical protein